MKIDLWEYLLLNKIFIQIETAGKHRAIIEWEDEEYEYKIEFFLKKRSKVIEKNELLSPI